MRNLLLMTLVLIATTNLFAQKNTKVEDIAIKIKLVSNWSAVNYMYINKQSDIVTILSPRRVKVSEKARNDSAYINLAKNYSKYSYAILEEKYHQIIDRYSTFDTVKAIVNLKTILNTIKY